MRTGILCCVLLLSAAPLAAQTALEPFQARALESVLQTMDPDTRRMLRPQLEQTLRGMDEQQVAMMLAAMPSPMLDDSDEEVVEATDVAMASEDDLAFNRAQFEPALRKAWSVEKSFDDFVDARLAADCPARGSYAVWGSAWRYEVYPLAPAWSRASHNADLDVEVLGASYAPQDGRYRFDFSGLGERFDEQAVATAIAEACRAYRSVGEDFLARARATVSDASPQAGGPLERDANARVADIGRALETELQARAPGTKQSVLQALMNGERLN